MPLIQEALLLGHTDRIWSVHWHPSGGLLASAGADKTIRIWKVKNDLNECISILTNSHTKTIRRLRWSPCGQYLASASFDSTVCIWRKQTDETNWELVCTLDGHESEVKGLDWSFDGVYLASSGRDRSLWIWERSSEEVDCWDCSDVKNDHSKDVKHVVWHPKFHILASCSYDDTIKIYNKLGDDWTCIDTLVGHSSTVWSADFSAAGDYLATASDDKTVRFWKNIAHDQLPEIQPNSWKCVSILRDCHTRAIYDISWCVSSDLIATASGDNSITIYSRDSTLGQADESFGISDRTRNSHKSDVNCISWRPGSGGTLASAGDDRVIRLWSLTQDSNSKSSFEIPEAMIKQSDSDAPEPASNQARKCLSNTDYNVNTYQSLLTAIRKMQDMQTRQQSRIPIDKLEEFLNISIKQRGPEPLALINISTDGSDSHVLDMTFQISGEIQEQSDIHARVVIDGIRITLPKRSHLVFAVLYEIFVLDKTGDLFRINSECETKFVLGHLFSLSDIKFMINNERQRLEYIITADRDEKIRVSNCSNSAEIARFCFGHNHLVSQLEIIGPNRFLSIDCENNICIWDLSQINELPESNTLTPVRYHSMSHEATKKIRPALSMH